MGDARATDGVNVVLRDRRGEIIRPLTDRRFEPRTVRRREPVVASESRASGAASGKKVTVKGGRGAGGGASGDGISAPLYAEARGHCGEGISSVDR